MDPERRERFALPVMDPERRERFTLPVMDPERREVYLASDGPRKERGLPCQ